MKLSKILDIVILPVQLVMTFTAFMMLVIITIFKPIIFVTKFIYNLVSNKVKKYSHKNDYRDYYED